MKNERITFVYYKYDLFHNVIIGILNFTIIIIFDPHFLRDFFGVLLDPDFFLYQAIIFLY